MSDLDALEATARAPHLNRAASFVTSAEDVLALITRLRNAEAVIEDAWMHSQAVTNSAENVRKLWAIRAVTSRYKTTKTKTEGTERENGGAGQ